MVRDECRAEGYTRGGPVASGEVGVLGPVRTHEVRGEPGVRPYLQIVSGGDAYEHLFTGREDNLAVGKIIRGGCGGVEYDGQGWPLCKVAVNCAD